MVLHGTKAVSQVAVLKGLTCRTAINMQLGAAGTSAHALTWHSVRAWSTSVLASAVRPLMAMPMWVSTSAIFSMLLGSCTEACLALTISAALLDAELQRDTPAGER